MSEIIDIFISENLENVTLEAWVWLRLNFTRGVFSSETLFSLWLDAP